MIRSSRHSEWLIKMKVLHVLNKSKCVFVVNQCAADCIGAPRGGSKGPRVVSGCTRSAKALCVRHQDTSYWFCSARRSTCAYRSAASSLEKPHCLYIHVSLILVSCRTDTARFCRRYTVQYSTVHTANAQCCLLPSLVQGTATDLVFAPTDQLYCFLRCETVAEVVESRTWNVCLPSCLLACLPCLPCLPYRPCLPCLPCLPTYFPIPAYLLSALLNNTMRGFIISPALTFSFYNILNIHISHFHFQIYNISFSVVNRISGGVLSSVSHMNIYGFTCSNQFFAAINYHYYFFYNTVLILITLVNLLK